MLYRTFIEKWTSPEYPPEPIALANLATVEATLGIALPTAFKVALTKHGAASTNITLLDTIVDRELELHDVHDFLKPNEIVSITQDWRPLGLPGDAVAFATDGGGNLFCFRADAAEAVWFWDHDFNSIEELAPSFEGWLARYCEIEPI